MNMNTLEDAEVTQRILKHIFVQSHERGRDGRGVVFNYGGKFGTQQSKDISRKEKGNPDWLQGMLPDVEDNGVIIGNLRAEPTTEFIKQKSPWDQQPYSLGGWNIVHNGTIANDAELRTNHCDTRIDSAAIVEVLESFGKGNRADQFFAAITRLEGSYAILAYHDDDVGTIYAACNYRPIYFAGTDKGIFFASSQKYFPSGLNPQMLQPYTAMAFTRAESDTMFMMQPLGSTHVQRGLKWKERCLVVCSGGLDSVVAATYTMQQTNVEVELLHFQYGCRAEDREAHAVREIAKDLGIKVNMLQLPVWNETSSPLLDKTSKISSGVAGSEFAHEWVPARNLVMLSVATAFAEANGFDKIVLGNNLEEAGAYPDNEPEFINRFNSVLPYAVNSNARVRVLMPVGNLMKHEIVKLGLQIGAPLHLTWSCYAQGTLHCGRCGPCYMRRTAFAINNTPEVIKYEWDEGDQDVLRH